MADGEEGLKEIVRGLDGLLMLGQWQVTLAKELRTKAEVLASSPSGAPPAAEEGGKSA